jgi:hypothetical protein
VSQFDGTTTTSHPEPSGSSGSTSCSADRRKAATSPLIGAVSGWQPMRWRGRLRCGDQPQDRRRFRMVCRLGSARCGLRVQHPWRGIGRGVRVADRHRCHGAAQEVGTIQTRTRRSCLGARHAPVVRRVPQSSRSGNCLRFHRRWRPVLPRRVESMAVGGKRHRSPGHGTRCLHSQRWSSGATTGDPELTITAEQRRNVTFPPRHR